MNPQVGLGRVLDRIAAATGVLRCRTVEIRRAELNGGDLGARVEELVAKLEQVADDLEAALA